MANKRPVLQRNDSDFQRDAKDAINKFPGNIGSTSEQLKGFTKLLCTQLIPYRSADEDHFSPYSDEEMAAFVESVRAQGILEPIIVRPLEDNPEKFEILAGHNRWRAAKQAGLNHIPAHVLQNCNNDTARIIFATTNMLRRENCFSDMVIGWWHYSEAVKYKRESNLKELVNNGLITENMVKLLRDENSRRNIMRYARCHQLIPELLALGNQKKLNIRTAEKLSYLSKAHQMELLEYKEHLNDSLKAEKLRRLERGEDEKKWTKENILSILFGENIKPQSTFVATQVSKVAKAAIKPDDYEKAPEIVKEGIKLYYYYQDHPESKPPEDEYITGD